MNGFDITANFAKMDMDLKKVMEAIAELKRNEVLIGIPEEANSRESDKATNAELMFIHTNGSPAKGIPARPILEPAITDSKDRVSASLRKAVDAAVKGDKEAIAPALKKAGKDGANIAKAWFTNPSNGWAGNNWRTVVAKTPKLRNKRFKAFQEQDFETQREMYAAVREEAKSTEATPLIDTGDLRKSITYVVRGNK